LAGRAYSSAQVKGTIKLLRYYRAFINSDKEEARHPEGLWGYGTINKDQARHRLKFLINVAVNRKAGIPDEVGRKQSRNYQIDLWYDSNDIKRWRQARIVPAGLRPGKFRIAEIQKRCGHIWREVGFYDEWFD
jgi:hypothetical protein